MTAQEAIGALNAEKLPKAKGWCRTSRELLSYFENRILSHLRVPYKVQQVSLRTGNPALQKLDNEYLNTLEMQTKSSPEVQSAKSDAPLVVIHGFASALGVFVNSYEPLSKQHKVFAIDLLGFGNSSKPKFPRGGNGAEAEDLFVDSIEAWRLANGLDRMILCAHSFGAYLATSYCIKYPRSAAGLILVDPWGFSLPDPEAAAKRPFFRRAVLGPLSTTSPLSILRATGPYALRLFSWSRRDLWENRFANIGAGDDVMHYLYHSNVQATGDSGFVQCLAPFAMARRPMLHRVAGLDPALPVTFLYGGRSWISSATGDQARAARGDAAAGRTHVEVVPDAGHHIYADQPALFAAAVLRAAARSTPTAGGAAAAGGNGVSGTAAGGGGAAAAVAAARAV